MIRTWNPTSSQVAVDWRVDGDTLTGTPLPPLSGAPLVVALNGQQWEKWVWANHSQVLRWIADLHKGS